MWLYCPLLLQAKVIVPLDPYMASSWVQVLQQVQTNINNQLIL